MSDRDLVLTPFHSDSADTLYTSKTVKSTRSFGYTYPELIDWNTDPVQLAKNVRSAANQLYSLTENIYRRSVTATNHQYFVNIKINSSEVPEPLLVHFFIGSIPPMPINWARNTTLAGTYAAMTHTEGTAVGQIALTHALMSARIPDLTPPNVIPYLSTQLGYHIQHLDDSPVSPRSLPSLKVAVVGQEVEQPAQSDTFPRYGPMVEYWQATHRLAGGLQQGEAM